VILSDRRRCPRVSKSAGPAYKRMLRFVRLAMSRPEWSQPRPNRENWTWEAGGDVLALICNETSEEANNG
jgi:hypothetical protein